MKFMLHLRHDSNNLSFKSFEMLHRSNLTAKSLKLITTNFRSDAQTSNLEVQLSHFTVEPMWPISKYYISLDWPISFSIYL